MFDFKKKKLNLEELFIDGLTDRDAIAKMLMFDVEHGKIEFDDDMIQMFIPIGLSFINWEWLDLVAKHTVPQKEYQVFHDTLMRVEAIRESTIDKYSMEG